MSIRIEVIADTVPELIATLRDIASQFEGVQNNFADVSVHTVDKTYNLDNIEAVTGAGAVPPPAAETEAPQAPAPVTPEPETPAQSLTIAEMLPILSTAYRNGDQSLKDEIVALKNGLGLQLLSHAKTDAHRDAFAAFIAQKGLTQ